MLQSKCTLCKRKWTVLARPPDDRVHRQTGYPLGPARADEREGRRLAVDERENTAVVPFRERVFTHCFLSVY